MSTSNQPQTPGRGGGLTLSFEGQALSGPGYSVHPLPGDFGDFRVLSVEGFRMWDTYEIRPAHDGAANNVLSFFLHNYERNGSPYWAARFPLRCSNQALFACLDALNETALPRVFEADHSLPELVHAHSLSSSPVWESGVVLHRGLRGAAFGFSAGTFRDAGSWRTLTSAALDRLLTDKLGPVSFGYGGSIVFVRIAGPFGAVEADLEDQEGRRLVTITGKDRAGIVAAHLYCRLALQTRQPDPNLLAGVRSILERLRDSSSPEETAEDLLLKIKRLPRVLSISQMQPKKIYLGYTAIPPNWMHERRGGRAVFGPFESECAAEEAAVLVRRFCNAAGTDLTTGDILWGDGRTTDKGRLVDLRMYFAES